MNISIIVTYNPDDKVLDIINSLLHQNTEIIVVDNCSDNSKIINKVLEIQKDKENINFHKLKKNLGLSKAQNIGIKYSRERNAEFTFFFDQDTKIPNNYIETMIENWNQIDQTDNKIGILGPNYLNPETKEGAKFLILDKNKYKLFKINYGSNEVNNLISSGLMVKNTVFDSVGLMDESFFIDQIDTDFSIRVNDNGYKIYVTANTQLEHCIGETSTKKIFGKVFKTNNHSAMRKYFFIRNSFWTIKKNRLSGPMKVYIAHQIIYTFLTAILFEKNKGIKLIKMGQGFIDGIRYFSKENQKQ
ncbi:glycosyltransferase family 2 protein [Enterococcus devriesei]|uniref:glycosyltransferase family 2 protein n=1 Tax=Enterococcus devriesei TaxID=319970 RepID=UPI0028B17A57|nr:glycosyltransferase family 2 protein [Enterococcus devriesei]